MLFPEFLFWWFVVGVCSAGFLASLQDAHDSWLSRRSRKTVWFLMGVVVLGGMASLIVALSIMFIAVAIGILVWLLDPLLDRLFPEKKETS